MSIDKTTMVEVFGFIHGPNSFPICSLDNNKETMASLESLVNSFCLYSHRPPFVVHAMMMLFAVGPNGTLKADKSKKAKIKQQTQNNKKQKRVKKTT